MRRKVETNHVKPPAPHSWAIASNGTNLYSVHVPIRPDGTIEIGDPAVQAEVTFSDLEATLSAAGARFSDVVMVQIYLTSLSFKAVVDDVYRRYFVEPYPVRACIAVSELPTPGTIIEIVVTTTIDG